MPADLTQSLLWGLFHFNETTGVFTRIVARTNAVRVGQAAGSLGSDGYLRIWIGDRSYKAHRLAWLYVYGAWPQGQIDHRNGIRVDNRIANLREATQSQQNANAALRSDSTTDVRGVSFHKATGKYTARLTKSGRLVHASYHATIEEAAAAFQKAAATHFADFVRSP